MSNYSFAPVDHDIPLYLSVLDNHKLPRTNLLDTIHRQMYRSSRETLLDSLVQYWPGQGPVVDLHLNRGLKIEPSDACIWINRSFWKDVSASPCQVFVLQRDFQRYEYQPTPRYFPRLVTIALLEHFKNPWEHLTSKPGRPACRSRLAGPRRRERPMLKQSIFVPRRC